MAVREFKESDMNSSLITLIPYIGVDKDGDMTYIPVMTTTSGSGEGDQGSITLTLKPLSYLSRSAEEGATRIYDIPMRLDLSGHNAITKQSEALLREARKVHLAGEQVRRLLELVKAKGTQPPTLTASWNRALRGNGLVASRLGAEADRVMSSLKGYCDTVWEDDGIQGLNVEYPAQEELITRWTASAKDNLTAQSLRAIHTYQTVKRLTSDLASETSIDDHIKRQAEQTGCQVKGAESIAQASIEALKSMWPDTWIPRDRQKLRESLGSTRIGQATADFVKQDWHGKSLVGRSWADQVEEEDSVL
jgi:hypothetical protein